MSGLEQTTRETAENLDDLRKKAVRILRGGDPERGTERRSIEQAGSSFSINRLDRAFVDQRLDGLGCRAKAGILTGPLRGIAEHRRPVEQHDALDFRLQSHFDIGG